MMQIQIPWQCREILERFSQHHLQAYLVGGCVRDSLLGKQPKDWDICTEALPEQVVEFFKADKVILTGLQHGTVTVLLGGLAVEITTFRIDGEYEDNRHPKEVFFTSDLQKDLSRRDFTINALAYHPQTGIVDDFDGISDLQQGIIRCVGDAPSRYQEDGLRIMRAVRFACVLNFQFEQETEAAIGQYSYLLEQIARERIQVELDKILTSSWAAYGLQTLARLHCLPYFLPELEQAFIFEQTSGHTVFSHTAKAVALVPDTIVLRLAALLHDIGKPVIWQTHAGEPLFSGYESVSVQLTETILERLRYDKKTINQVKILVENHTRVLKPDVVWMRKAVADLGPASVAQLLELQRADILAADNSEQTAFLQELDAAKQILQQIIENDDCCSLKQLAVSGRDLTAMGFKGKQVGEMLAQLLQMVLEQPERNEREFLLQKAKEEWTCKNN